MSDDDKDDGYEPVVGFSVPIKRVLDHSERPVNPDGSYTGSLFMTIEGCTFKDGALEGSAAATVGAPSVVVEIVEGDRDYLTDSKSSSRYIVSAHDIVQVAVNAHKARMGESVSSEGGGNKKADLGSPATLRRFARLVWIQVGKARNPLLNQVMSSGTNDRLINEKLSAWNAAQVELSHALFHVVFHQADPDLGLINRALDFLES